MTRYIATALATASKPDPELAADVVHEALSRCEAPVAQSVLLFLSDEFGRHAQAAVHAASRAAHCLQVAGCTAPGLFTEEDWVLDRPAACAMVFGAGVGLCTPEAEQPVLSLATPGAATPGWLMHGERFGALSTDSGAQTPGRVWVHGKPVTEGRFEAQIAGTRGAVGVSQGLRVLTPPLTVSASQTYDLLRLAEQPALNTLLRELPLEMREKPLPLHTLFACVVSGDPAVAIADGRYEPVPIIAVNADEGSVTLAAHLEVGAHLFWGMRSPLAAERHMGALIDGLASRITAPDFALLFSCLGRGPYFFGGEERDLALVKERFPGMPLAGIYGGGEIGRIGGANRLLQNSAVLGLFEIV